MKGYKRYFLKKLLWFVITLIAAVILNFVLPRLMPSDPIATITNRITEGMNNQNAVMQIYREYARKFGTDQPMWKQFLIYVGNLLKGDMGVSFQQYPRKVTDIVAASVVWTIALQLPAILVGWMIGNLLGALAAYIRKGFDKVLVPVSLFVSGLPAFGLAVTLLVVFGITLKWLPISGGYSYDLLPSFSWRFIKSVIVHYQMPFWSIVLIAIGGQAIGMRSMSIYELNADYVKYSRFLGVKDMKVVGYVFRNAMLPQVTGLALSIGTMIGGALVAETIFSYPGLGSTILSGISSADYPLISGVTLIITIMVLTMSFAIEMLYGVIDPRVKAAQSD
ncbi:MAG: ABC transporter permease [Oscillospiraceae bacterium]|jgi:peptide/nickel transport system permease protein|nr:ABC transporter permease [Oscillospiraceae bacterium]